MKVKIYFYFFLIMSDIEAVKVLVHRAGAAVWERDFSSSLELCVS